MRYDELASASVSQELQAPTDGVDESTARSPDVWDMVGLKVPTPQLDDGNTTGAACAPEVESEAEAEPEPEVVPEPEPEQAQPQNQQQQHQGSHRRPSMVQSLLGDHSREPTRMAPSLLCLCLLTRLLILIPPIPSIWAYPTAGY